VTLYRAGLISPIGIDMVLRRVAAAFRR